MRVTHPIYGQGTVLNANNDYYIVNFDNGVGKHTVSKSSCSILDSQMIFG